MLLRRIVLPAIAVALLLAPAAQAQTPKPVVVVSISGVDELLGDVDYLTKAADLEDYGNLIKFMAAPYTVGVDKTKPWGFIVQMNEDAEPATLGFVPVKDLDVVFAALKDQIGEPRDAGNGVFEITDPAPMYVKEKGGFAFISNEKKHLKTLPDNPVKLLDGLNKKYDIAVRAFLDNVPQEQKTNAIDQIRAAQEAALEDQGLDEDDPQAILAKRLAENQVQRLEDMINDTDELTVGWTTDSVGKKTFFDIAMTVKPNTPSAARMKLLKGNDSAFGGLALKDAALNLNITTRMDKDDIEQLTALLDTVKTKAFEEIDDDENLDTDKRRKMAKDVVGGLINTLASTAKSGKLDGGVALVLKPKAMTLVAGGAVAEPKMLEDSLRTLVELAKDEPDFPEVKFNAESHGGVVFHTLSAPVDEEQAREVLGETLDIVVGIGPKSAYLALGTDAADTLKKVIDGSSMKTKDAPPMELKVALTPIFEFANSVEDNPVLELIAATLAESEGKDTITLKGSPIKNGMRYRLSVDEGVLKAVGQAVKFGNSGL